jgi:hypothetical protein
LSRPYKLSSGLQVSVGDMAVINLSDENLRNLEKIQTIVRIEDGTDSKLDGVLARVLDFYRKFVPYD